MLDALQQLAADAAPQEICGILLGVENRVTGHIPTSNISPSPERHFEIDPAQLIQAERTMREGGAAILGYYHSHPLGNVRPSSTDAESAAADGRLWLIVNGTDAALWRAVPNGEIFGRFDKVAMDCLLID
ncbi:Mov34/MPN/PAD-1 family protein [Parasphingorhabdus sp.]|jgi:proteasome lid subunit RPN8/RPN11|uniref:Mov34/MPN/PAD-1 family protein n=1 Tax=Parasphingorhabdus sp. TaxID=2709688 RepID=UPI003D2AF2AF